MKNTAAQLVQRYQDFPDISFEEFRELPGNLRDELIRKNRVVSTDTYNRTMAFYKGAEAERNETYVLQMRRVCADGYMIVHGIRRALEKTVARPILESEVNFAAQFYAQANVKHFNEKMWRDVLENHGGYLPLEINAVPDGTVVLACDPVLSVTGPGELAAHFEPEFHRIFYTSLVATDAHRINNMLGGKANRFIEVGKRGAYNEEMHFDAMEAAYVGGGLFLTSNDAVAAAHEEFKDVGTMGHRFIQFHENELEAFEAAINSSESVSLLIDLIDSWKGIDKALALKKKYRQSGKKIWIRLDSGDIKAQTKYVLQKYQEMGFTDSGLDKVVIEDLDSVEQIGQFEAEFKGLGFDPEKFVLYGAGGLLITSNKERSKASSGYKLAAVDDKAKIKFSSSLGKESLPGDPILIHDSAGERMIAQRGEMIGGQPITTTAYKDGKVLIGDSLSAARENVKNSFTDLIEQKVWVEGQGKGAVVKTSRSALTQRLGNDLRAFYFEGKIDKAREVYPMQMKIPFESRSWSAEMPDYQPQYYTAPSVLKNDCTVVENGWADSAKLNKVDFSKRRSSEGPIVFNEAGMPLNPRGRKGLAGRGLLGKWGPNHAADNILTYTDEAGMKKLLVIKRTDTGNLAFPGGFLNGDEKARAGALRELGEEAFVVAGENLDENRSLLEKVMARAQDLGCRYIDDYRNTDNAWIEGSAFHAELTREEFEALQPIAGDDAADAMWIEMTQDNLAKLFKGHLKMAQQLLTT